MLANFTAVHGASILIGLIAVLGPIGAPGLSAETRKGRPRPIPASHRATQQSGLELTDDNGPWMVFVASFVGSGAKEHALELVQELRQRKWSAYLHAQNFDFSQPVKGLGVTPEGKPKMMRYRTNHRTEEWAVLVGDFPSVDDSRLQATVEKLKTYRPDCIEKQGEHTTLRFAQLRDFQKKSNRNPKKNQKGPLGHAFVTRNPRLPPDTPTGTGIDSLVVKMNKDLKYNLLDCPSSHTICVATFRGKVVIDQKQIKAIEEDGDMIPSKLDDAANRANRLVQSLRRKGVEAYQFHDRYASYVTVGSFDPPSSLASSGHVPITPEMDTIIQAYGPKKQQVDRVGGGVESKVLPQDVDGIFLDMQPTPMAIPRYSVAVDLGRSMVR